MLERDGWHCQSCGRAENLQVHHIEPRSRLGDDTTENLIALCVRCHQKAHRQRQDTAQDSGTH
ncbi:MAG: HNH endonuclease [Candidatus Acidiferrales bacterium]